MWTLSELFLLILCLNLITPNVLGHTGDKTKSVEIITEDDDNDAVIIEAAELPESKHHRSSRQVFFSSQGSWATALGEGGPCVTSKGHLGNCVPFKSCYPYFKDPKLNAWQSWALQDYDQCTYFKREGGQSFGVCCTNQYVRPDEDPNNIPVIAPPPLPDDLKHQVKQNYPQFIFGHEAWPPTHPTIPQYITHPWNHTQIPAAATHPPPVFGGNGDRLTTQWSQWPPSIPTHATAPYPSWTQKPVFAQPGFPQYPAVTNPPRPPPTQYPSYPSYPTKPPYKPPTTQKPLYPVVNPPPIGGGGGSGGGSIDSGQYGSCGIKNGYQDQERIVGGHNADPNEWPWTAVMFIHGKQFCGGSVINKRCILTAAHCVATFTQWEVGNLRVNLGDHNIRLPNEVKHEEYKVIRIVRHKGFDSRTLYNDVAILVLDRDIVFSKNIRSVCLAQGGEQYNGQTATVVGWGSLRENGPQPQILQEVSIPIWTNELCRYKYGNAAPGGIIESMICAGKANQDSCSGDSGGPMMVKQGRNWVQVGIVSWGIGCGKGNYPGVYTRVSSFRQWIDKNCPEGGTRF